MSVSTDSLDPVEVVLDLLTNQPDQAWTQDPPDIYRQRDVDQQQRMNKGDPAIYVWSPTGTDRTPLGAEYGFVDESHTVQVDCWTQTDISNDYAGDVVAILDEYGNDNEQLTQYQRIRPELVNDIRAETALQYGSSQVVSVEISLRRLNEVTEVVTVVSGDYGDGTYNDGEYA